MAEVFSQQIDIKLQTKDAEAKLDSLAARLTKKLASPIQNFHTNLQNKIAVAENKNSFAESIKSKATSQFNKGNISQDRLNNLFKIADTKKNQNPNMLKFNKAMLKSMDTLALAGKKASSSIKNLSKGLKRFAAIAKVGSLVGGALLTLWGSMISAMSGSLAKTRAASAGMRLSRAEIEALNGAESAYKTDGLLRQSIERVVQNLANPETQADLSILGLSSQKLAGMNGMQIANELFNSINTNLTNRDDNDNSKQLVIDTISRLTGIDSSQQKAIFNNKDYTGQIHKGPIGEILKYMSTLLQTTSKVDYKSVDKSALSFDKSLVKLRTIFSSFSASAAGPMASVMESLGDVLNQLQPSIIWIIQQIPKIVSPITNWLVNLLKIARGEKVYDDKGKQQSFTDILLQPLRILWDKLENLFKIITQPIVDKLVELKNKVSATISSGFHYLVSMLPDWMVKSSPNSSDLSSNPAYSDLPLYRDEESRKQLMEDTKNNKNFMSSLPKYNPITGKIDINIKLDKDLKFDKPTSNSSSTGMILNTNNIRN